MNLALVSKCYPLRVASRAGGGLRRVSSSVREVSTIPKCGLVPQGGRTNNVECYAGT